MAKPEAQKAAEKAAKEKGKAAEKAVEPVVEKSGSEKSDYASHPKFAKFKSIQGAE